MPPSRFASVLWLGLGLLPALAQAQTVDGRPPALPGLVGAPRPSPRAGRNGLGPAAAKPLPPKLTAAEQAEERKLERDMKICIGC